LEVVLVARKTAATAASAAIRLFKAMRMVSPQGSAISESALRMSFAFLDSHIQFIVPATAAPLALCHFCVTVTSARSRGDTCAVALLYA
jgi:hypothetical protein